ncbi:hypothetical protein C8R45DRAFT_1050940 [Mycena sanguinolenta]|nr:hypothetical protein C8R45DRAFT_1050940 [Mycena sanguinolenta]
MPYEPIFNQITELNRDLRWDGERDGGPTVPGQPLLEVWTEGNLNLNIQIFLKDDLLHDKLNDLFPILWLVGTQRSDHVSPLHEQLVFGRNIILTEDPNLHLLWYYNRIFLKPLPPYLTSYAFWKGFLCGIDDTQNALRQAALGFLRSYAYLIKSVSDVEIARQNGLIPKDIKAGALLRFLDRFKKGVRDEETTPRYQYGQLRLSRLNTYIRLYKFKLYYHQTYGQYGDLFPGLIAPFIFVFAVVSVALSAMQVILAVRQSTEANQAWRAFASTSQWFGVFCLLLALACGLMVVVVICVLMVRELVFALGKGRGNFRT